jgi:threonine dehydrogenase-like Zn-dependent dehydrogenase
MMPTMESGDILGHEAVGKVVEAGRDIKKLKKGGALMNKGLTAKTGQTHMRRYLQPLLNKIESGEIDPSHIISHKVKIDDVPEMYQDVS